MKKVGLAFSFVFAVLVSCASAQVCPDCPDPKPTCAHNQEPSCRDGQWQCPAPNCDNHDRHACEDRCGEWDPDLCICNERPGGCSQCDPYERDRCFIDCGFNDSCWDEEFCYCFIPNDGFAPSRRPHRVAVFMGHYPPHTTSCEDGNRKVPTSLAMSHSDVRIHQGRALTDEAGNVLAEHAWGTSMLIRWAVLDQNTDLFKRGDMFATEWVTPIGGVPVSINLDRTVSVPDGIFGDIYATVTDHAPGPFRPGEYSLVRQVINIHWDGSEWYEVLRHCVKITDSDVIIGAPCN